MAVAMDEALPPPMVSGARDRTFGGNRAFHNFYNDYSHISDPNLRRRLALSEIDKVPFGLYRTYAVAHRHPYSVRFHLSLFFKLTWPPAIDIRAVLVAGVGFLLDSYDIFSINLITTLLGMVFWSGETSSNGFGGNKGILPDTTNQALKASTSAGIVVGMILFGWLAEYVLSSGLTRSLG